jgi:hypothetical protein
LTGETPTDKVNWFKFFCVKLEDVFVSFDIGPLLFKDFLAVFVTFYLPDTFHA